MGRPVSGTIRFLSQSGQPLDLKLRLAAYGHRDDRCAQLGGLQRRVSGPHNGIATHPAEKLARTDRRCFNNLHASFLGDGSCGLVCDLHKGGASLNRSNGFSKLVLKDLFQPFV